ncbi:MAG: hypothetical protein K0S65_3338 [Labilithrix sp.]|nr:hypothetical protein [Labilithrix sp.]
MSDLATRLLSLAAASLVAASLFACDDSAGPRNEAGGGSADAGADGAAFDSGKELAFQVPETGRVHITLDPPAVVDESAAWDLAFEGYDIFTNGGVSGSGAGAAFGPLDAVVFLGDRPPEVPFLTSDRTGGAFLDWYEYSGAPAHALYSRFHVHGVRDGSRLFKVQVLGYYGQRDGAAVAALYSLRYTELGASGPGPVQELTHLDGTAGGPSGAPTTPSECVDLGTGARSMKTPDEARNASDWHLCFRRDAISVNGERGGPRGVGAVDLDVDATKGETLAQVETRTPESERARFDAVNAASFEGKTFRGDRIVSVFGDAWLDRSSSPPNPAYAAWLVQAADGKRKMLVGFARFESATTTSPGTIVLRAKLLQ